MLVCQALWSMLTPSAKEVWQIGLQLLWPILTSLAFLSAAWDNAKKYIEVSQKQGVSLQQNTFDLLHESYLVKARCFGVNSA